LEKRESAKEWPERKPGQKEKLERVGELKLKTITKRKEKRNAT